MEKVYDQHSMFESFLFLKNKTKQKNTATKPKQKTSTTNNRKTDHQAQPVETAEPCCASQSIRNYSNLIMKKDKSVNSLFKGFLRWK